MAIYNELFGLYNRLYFAMGDKRSEPVAIGDVLPRLRTIARQAREKQ